jgi:FkbM family methyltransferase
MSAQPTEATPGEAAFCRVRDCRHGRLAYNVNDLYVGRSIELYGEYNEGRNQLFDKLLREGDVAVEVGAFNGAHTVFLARKVGDSGAVVAFEPQRLGFQMLCASLSLNSLVNVYALHAAAGARSGQVVVAPMDYRKRNNFAGLSIGMAREGESVPLSAIDVLDLQRCRLIKVSAEGMEVDVLRGAADTIRRHKPILFVDNYQTDRSRPLLEHMLGLGYRLYWSLVPMFNPDNFAGNQENVFPDVVSVGVLGIPPGDDTAVEGRQIQSADESWHGQAAVKIHDPD